MSRRNSAGIDKLAGGVPLEDLKQAVGGVKLFTNDGGIWTDPGFAGGSFAAHESHQATSTAYGRSVSETASVGNPDDGTGIGVHFGASQGIGAHANGGGFAQQGEVGAHGGFMAGAGSESSGSITVGMGGVGSIGGSTSTSFGEFGADAQAHAGYSHHHIDIGFGGDLAAGIGIGGSLNVSIDTRPFEHAGEAVAHGASEAAHDIGHEASHIGHSIKHIFDL